VVATSGDYGTSFHEILLNVLSGRLNRREQQEATTLSLQLLQNCLMLINTILIQRTIDRQGLWARLQPEDFRALTPLFYGHINPYGLFELDLEGPSFLEAA
jgi:hypothetical protein